jgi:very-short-patch-repair endonuclease
MKSMRRILPDIRQRTRELRQPQTPAEQAVWRFLSNRQAGGFKFRRQHPIGRFIVDFYCPEAKLIIEIDGDSHADQVDYDQARTEWLESQGCHVIRFTNQEVKENISAVIENILEYCKNKS